MAGFISLSSRSGNEHIWSSGNWVFRGFMERLIIHFKDNEKMVQILTQCMHMQGLYIDLLEDEHPNIKHELISSIKDVAKEILERRLEVCVDGNVLSQDHQEKYFSEITNLLHFLEGEESVET